MSALLVKRERDRSEGGTDQSSFLDIIESSHGHIGRNPDTALSHHIEGANGQQIAGGHHGLKVHPWF